MQRYGPPPSYPNLKIPGLNAPIPEVCTVYCCNASNRLWEFIKFFYYLWVSNAVEI